MAGFEFKESDWKLFRKRIVNWQENYIDKLNKEYLALLSEDRNASPQTMRHYVRTARIKKDIEEKFDSVFN